MRGYLLSTIQLLLLSISAAFQAIIHREAITTSLDFNGLEFDEADMNDFVDQRSAKMDSIGIDDELVRQEYEAWRHRYQKDECEVRYKRFKKNFLRQLEYDSEGGAKQFYNLNEYGDFSSGENDAKSKRSLGMIVQIVCSQF